MLANLACLAWFFEDAEATLALARRALGNGRLLASVGSDSLPFLETIWAMSGGDDIEGARAAAEAGLADARERGSAFGFVASCGVAAVAALRAGDMREAEAHARTGIEFPVVPLFVRPAIYGFLALCLIERGEFDEAETALADGFVIADLPVLVHWNLGFYARGLLRLAQGRPEEGLTELKEFARREELCCMEQNPYVPWRVDAARACLLLDHREEADALLAEHERLAARWGAPGPIGIGLQGQAAAAADGVERIALLERACELLEQSPRRLDHARVLFDLGVALRRDGRRREAQRRLSEAIALARRCGATVLATKANDELGVLKSRPRRLQFSGVESLTASERRIALMAADGLTNPQIAQALFVTAKTVENHLGRIYIKLAINSRNQLPAALSEAHEAFA